MVDCIIDPKIVEELRAEQELLWYKAKLGMDVRTEYANVVKRQAILFGAPVVEIGSPNSINIFSASFDSTMPTYAVEKTTTTTYHEQRLREKKAGDIWAYVPLAGRQAFLNEYVEFMEQKEENGFQPNKEALIRSIMIDNDKTYQLAKGEVEKALEWAKKAASPEFGQEVAAIYAVDSQWRRISNINEIGDNETVAIYDDHTMPWEDGVLDSPSENYDLALGQQGPDFGVAAGNTSEVKVPQGTPTARHAEFNMRRHCLKLWAAKNGETLWAMELRRKHDIDIRSADVVEILQQGLYSIWIGREVKYHENVSVNRIVASNGACKTVGEERAASRMAGLPNIHEGAGPNAMIIAEDASSELVAAAIKAADNGVTNNRGARCTKDWMVLVASNHHDDAVRHFVNAFKKPDPVINPHGKYQVDEDKLLQLIQSGEKFDISQAYILDDKLKPKELKGNGPAMKKAFVDDHVKYLRAAANHEKNCMAIVADGKLYVNKGHDKEAIAKLINDPSLVIEDMPADPGVFAVIRSNSMPNGLYPQKVGVIWKDADDVDIERFHKTEVFSPISNLILAKDKRHMVDIVKEAKSQLSGSYNGSIEGCLEFNELVGFHGSFHHSDQPQNAKGENTAASGKDMAPKWGHSQTRGPAAGTSGGPEATHLYRRPGRDCTSHTFVTATGAAARAGLQEYKRQGRWVEGAAHRPNAAAAGK